jgi:hypothetical protein
MSLRDQIARLSPEEFGRGNRLAAEAAARRAERLGHPIPQSAQETLVSTEDELVRDRREAMLRRAPSKDSMCEDVLRDIQLPKSISQEAFLRLMDVFYENDYVVVRRSALKPPAAE